METMIVFLVASMTLIITPGPDLIYVLTRGIEGGKISGVVSAVGVSSGILVHTIGAAFGLALLIQASPLAFFIIKTAGAVYLIYLGLCMLRSMNCIDFEGDKSTFNISKCFTQGFVSNVLNPKIILFFVAFLPQFVPLESTSKRLDMVVYGCAFALMTAAVFTPLGLFAGGIGGWLKAKGKLFLYITKGSGVILLILGACLLSPLGR